ncbi:MAG: hypothetical protein J1F32_01875 [Erysipelotrichales bacterium]|nr:hypothetical protein [Erysipelotrichales bacterium]
MKHDWYTLDNAAKIFPAVYKRSDTNSYRISVTLKSEVNPDILLLATKDALKRFPHLCVKLKSGLFWYYLEHNYNEPMIEKEDPFLFNSVRLHSKAGFMFSITYFGRRINLEMFHALTDGTGASEFLKTIVYYYLIHSGISIENDGSIQTEEVEILTAESFDDFNENYDSHIQKPEKEEKAFQIKGRLYKDNWTGLVQLIMSVDSLKEVAHKYGTTVTGFMSSIILYSLYLSYFKNVKQKNNLRLFIPVNARKFFDSYSLRNFMLYIRTTGEFRDKNLSFKDVVDYVKHTLTNINRDVLLRQLVSNVDIEKHFYVKILPLFVKNAIMKFAYKMFGQDSTTVSFSNLGLIKLPKGMEEYIERFEFLIGVSKLSPVNIGAVSYNDTFVLSYATKFVDRHIIRRIATLLVEEGINVSVEVNDLEVQ